MTSFTLFSKNGKILPITEATVSLLNIEYSYGYGVYETLKVRNNKLFFAEYHIERLEHSAKVLGIQIPFSASEIHSFLNTFVEALHVDACNIKIVVIGGQETTLYIFASAPLFPDRKLYKTGASLITYTYERLFPTAKTLNMLPSYMAYKLAKEHDCYDALLIDSHNVILEGTRTNFCLIQGNTIFHAPSSRILGGITLYTLKQMLENSLYTIKEKEIHLEDLRAYDGAFITSTSTKIMPVSSIDSYKFPSIPESIISLMKQYDNFLDSVT